MDVEKIFRGRINQRRAPAEARAVLVLLGFEGIQDFSRRSGLNHQTVGELLGTCKMKHKKHHNRIVGLNEVLHTAFIDQRTKLSRPAQKYICDWARRWQNDVIKNTMTRQGYPDVVVKSTVLRDRKRKQQVIRDGIQATFKALEWR